MLLLLIQFGFIGQSSK